MIVVIMVVRRNCGAYSSATLGRFSVPAAFFSLQSGDSGRNGRMTISGIAGIKPEIIVYRQAACGSDTVPSALKNSGKRTAGKSAAHLIARLLANATIKPPNELHACV